MPGHLHRYKLAGFETGVDGGAVHAGPMKIGARHSLIVERRDVRAQRIEIEPVNRRSRNERGAWNYARQRCCRAHPWADQIEDVVARETPQRLEHALELFRISERLPEFRTGGSAGSHRLDAQRLKPQNGSLGIVGIGRIGVVDGEFSHANQVVGSGLVEAPELGRIAEGGQPKCGRSRHEYASAGPIPVEPVRGLPLDGLADIRGLQ